MAIATYEELARDAPWVSDDNLRLAKSLTNKNLFLSHSFQDMHHARWAFGMLEKAGAKVYVDARDASLQNVTAKDAAIRIRGVIRECKRLVALVTENTHTSKWIPWEKGIGDGVASEDRVAIFPLRSAGGSELWAKQEYLELYPRIEREWSYMYSRAEWIVRLPNGTSVSLSDWVYRSRP